MHNNFTKCSNIHSHGTRSNDKDDYHVHPVDTFTSKSFYHNAIKDWNNLPKNIRCTKSKNTFKKRVKKHLLEEMKKVEKQEYLYY